MKIKSKSNDLLKKIDSIGQLILKSKQNSNSIVDLLKFTTSSKNNPRLRAIKALTNVFSVYLNENRFRILNENETELFEKSTNLNADEKYILWMNKRYADFKEVMLDCLNSNEKKAKDTTVIKNTCISSLFELLKVETHVKLEMSKNEESTETKDKKNTLLPVEFLHSVIDGILLNEMNDKVLKKVKFYMGYTDIRYFTLKYILTAFYQKNKMTETTFENMLNLFSVMPGLTKDKPAPKKPPKVEEDEKMDEVIDDEAAMLKEFNENKEEEIAEKVKEEPESEIKFFALQLDNLTENSKVCQKDVHRKLFNDCFVVLLRHHFNHKLYKKLLIKLPEKIIPKMSNPLMMADFLTQSYNNGGLISVLALNSLFILINYYNLEYPNFYQKVYQLLDSSIFLTKYKDRFFQLLDMFLLSTHLSSTLVGAFIKKLSRMSLTCPPADLKFLILFIFNLLIRHKNCKVLIHNNKKVINDASVDPFDVNCNDFNKCNALKSSLWEIQSLKNHYSYYVSKEVEKLNNSNQAVEYQLDEAFENNSYESLIKIELDAKKGTPNCAINYNFNLDQFGSNYFDSSVSDILRIN